MIPGARDVVKEFEKKIDELVAGIPDPMTGLQRNAEACSRECRMVGTGGCDWPDCSCPTKSRSAEEWFLSKPIHPGFYERFSLLSSIDYFDGEVWRRRVTLSTGGRVESWDKAPGHGVICANQNLPWRPLLGLSPFEVKYTLEEIEGKAA